MSLSTYLASKYLNAERPSTLGKKRKRKEKRSASNGLIITDDDDVLGWGGKPTNVESHDTEGLLATNSSSAEFRKAKKNSWKTISGPDLQSKNSDADEADKIIAQAAAENSASQQKDEDPVIIDDGIMKMQDGTHAGLQSASSVAKQFEKRKKEEMAAWKAEEQSHGSKRSEETVYRDATGRRIDLTLRRQEAQREARLKAVKEREEKEAQNGDIQKAEKEKRKEMLDEARFLPLTRTIDDEEMNKELKERGRWNDPASQFMAQKKEGRSISGKPLYVGPSAPNRYGIRPGHRWDGVDRGNGFEAQRFKALNRSARNKDLDYSWQMDE